MIRSSGESCGNIPSSCWKPGGPPTPTVGIAWYRAAFPAAFPGSFGLKQTDPHIPKKLQLCVPEILAGDDWTERLLKSLVSWPVFLKHLDGFLESFWYMLHDWSDWSGAYIIILLFTVKQHLEFVEFCQYVDVISFLPNSVGLALSWLADLPAQPIFSTSRGQWRTCNVHHVFQPGIAV